MSKKTAKRVVNLTPTPAARKLMSAIKSFATITRPNNGRKLSCVFLGADGDKRVFKLARPNSDKMSLFLLGRKPGDVGLKASNWKKVKAHHVYTGSAMSKVIRIAVRAVEKQA